jgi:tRNA dimethylallyltransferase
LGTISLAIITGPTGTGKSRLAIELAERLDTEIVGADSVQVYKYMDIGSAKPSPEEREHIPHRMIDVAYPDEPFDAARYRELAGKACEEIAASGKRVLVVGGTGLYIKALSRGLFTAPPVSQEIRLRLNELARSEGKERLFHLLEQVDPESASHIHPHDAYRIIRALEIYNQTGKPISYFHQKHQGESQGYRYILRGLQMDRKVLYERIEQRVDFMIERGLREEVEKLIDMGYGPELKSMQTIGYRHMARVLLGVMNFDEAVKSCKRDTRRFAKRQLTWFQAQKEIVWINPSHVERLYQELLEFYQTAEDSNE